MRERKEPKMMNANTVESTLNKVAAGFTVYSINIFTCKGECAPNGWSFDNVEEAIAAHGDEEIYEWKLNGSYNDNVRVTIFVR